MKSKIMILALSAVSALLLASCGNVEEESYVSEPTATQPAVTEETTSADVTTATTAETIAETTAKTTVQTTAQTKATAVVTTSVQPEITENESTELTTNENGIYDDKDTGSLKVDEAPKVTYIEVDDFDETVDNPNPPGINESENYNQEAYEKLGIKVNLHGTNAEMSEQYYNACVAAYPSLPWCYGPGGVSIDTSREEVAEKLNSIIGDRDYHDMSIEELYTIYGYCEAAGRCDILSYFDELANKSFTSGGWIA